MITGIEPAFALAIQLQDGTKIINTGLTTRQHLATMAMQGLLSNAVYFTGAGGDNAKLAAAACAIADLMILELKKGDDDTPTH